MTIKQVSAKIDLRLNKGASSDFDNITSYQKQEAFNKAVLELVRRLYRGKNQTQEGDEETTARVDDLQILLKKDLSLILRDRGIYYETSKIPTDYLYFKRLTPFASKEECEGIQLKSYLKEEANVDEYSNILPSFDFQETFHTIIGNKFNIYHNKDFVINKVQLVYYRKPKEYNFKKLEDIVEFKDDLAELLVDEACKILASDIESPNQIQLASQRIENNN